MKFTLNTILFFTLISYTNNLLRRTFKISLTKQYNNFIYVTISFCQAIFVVILKIPGIFSQQYKDLHMCVVKGTNIDTHYFIGREFYLRKI